MNGKKQSELSGGTLFRHLIWRSMFHGPELYRRAVPLDSF